MPERLSKGRSGVLAKGRHGVLVRDSEVSWPSSGASGDFVQSDDFTAEERSAEFQELIWVSVETDELVPAFAPVCLFGRSMKKRDLLPGPATAMT